MDRAEKREVNLYDHLKNLEKQLLNNWEEKINTNTKFDDLEQKIKQIEDIDIFNKLTLNNYNIDNNNKYKNKNNLKIKDN